MGTGKSKSKLKDRFDLQPFALRRLPVFWCMGPAGTGKSTICRMLQRSSKFNLVTVEHLIDEAKARGKNRAKIIEACINKGRPVPDNIVISLFKEYISMNYSDAKGFIFCNFPTCLKEAKLFETEICKVNLIIYCTLVLDSLLGRMITQQGDINIEQARMRYVVSQKEFHKICQHYSNKTLKFMNNYPPEDTCTKLVTDLEDFWGYKFDRLYNKN